MTFVKICGITRLADAQMAVRAGANAVGFVFAGGPRRITPARARAISTRLHPAVRKVGVFVDMPADRVLAVVDEACLDGVQLHGSEPVEVVQQVRRTKPSLLLFKAVPFEGGEVARTLHDLPVDALLVDPKDPADPLAPVDQIPAALISQMPRGRYVVAGGLNAQNVGALVRELQPWGVDVSRGVEVSPGKKDPAKVREFVRAVRGAESEVRAQS
ncbi:MAG: phosphoribosylanthranilate isomerase [Actinomycetota bacterium]|nr:phosphoribosylanthranilate isomerase [Actinomycetota bacterium]